MRPTLRLLSAAFLLYAGSALAATETLNIDQSHTRVGFSVRHFFTPVRGEFKTVSGTIALDQANLNASQVNVEIDAASINTNNERRDSLAPQDPYEEVVTVLLRIKGADLKEYRAGKIDKVEARKRVRVGEF